MSLRRAARKPIYQSKEAELERTGKTLTALPVILKSHGCTEYVLGSLEHKLTVITSLLFIRLLVEIECIVSKSG